MAQQIKQKGGDQYLNVSSPYGPRDGVKSPVQLSKKEIKNNLLKNLTLESLKNLSYLDLNNKKPDDFRPSDVIDDPEAELPGVSQFRKSKHSYMLEPLDYS